MRGIRCVLIERYFEPQRIPKGQNLTQRTLEHFYFWGIADELRKARVMPPEYPSSGIIAYGNMMSQYWAAPPYREVPVGVVGVEDRQRNLRRPAHVPVLHAALHLGEVQLDAQVRQLDEQFVDHVGGVLGVGQYAGKKAEIMPIWKKSLRELAACPNVNIKLGGLGMTSFGFGFEFRDVPPSSQELADTWRPYIEPCIEAFGVGRCMFESNFPPDKYSASYMNLWNAFKRLAAGYSADEKTALFSGAACKAYRISI